MFNFIKKQFIDVIQWPNPDDSLLMWSFTDSPMRKDPKRCEPDCAARRRWRCLSMKA